MALFWRDFLIWASPCGTRPHGHRRPEGREQRHLHVCEFHVLCFENKWAVAVRNGFPSPFDVKFLVSRVAYSLIKGQGGREGEQVRDGVKGRQLHLLTNRLARVLDGRGVDGFFKNGPYRIRVESSMRDRLSRAWMEWKWKR